MDMIIGTKCVMLKIRTVQTGEWWPSPEFDETACQIQPVTFYRAAFKFLLSAPQFLWGYNTAALQIPIV